MNKLHNPKQWAKIALASMVISAIAHQYNTFSPLHEYFHFLHYESQGKFISWTWSEVKVTESDPVGLTRGFYGESATYAWIFGTVLIFTNNPIFTPIVIGWAAGCFFSAWEYGHNSTDFAKFKVLTAHKLPPNAIHEHYNLHMTVCLARMAIALFIWYKRRF